MAGGHLAPEPFRLSGFSVDPDFRVTELAPNVRTVRVLANSAWVTTDEGVVVVDTGVAPQIGERVLGRIRESTDRPVKAIVYTHGHIDHVMGAKPMLADGGTIYAHENVRRRFDKYVLLREHISHINKVQFGGDGPREFVYPINEYHDRTSFKLGGMTFELMSGMGETDDATVVWVPEIRALFAGDFLVGSFPNIGNPYKVVRYEREWFEMLERILALDPEVIVPGHGQPLTRGPEMRQALQDNIEVLRFIHEQVAWHLNHQSTLEQAVAEIRLADHLAKSPYLQQVYSRIEFAVMNVWRRYAGWYDNSPTTLFPRRRRDFARAVRSLIGDDGKIVAEARTLHDAGDQLLALELLHVILDDEAEHPDAKPLERDVLQALAAGDECLMSANAWRAHLR